MAYGRGVAFKQGLFYDLLRWLLPIRRDMTIPDFRRWLKRREPVFPVGTRGHPRYCPLAEYLSDPKTGEPGWVVGSSYACVDRPVDPYYGPPPTPEWAQEFMHRIDSARGPGNTEAVFVREALAALALAEKYVPFAGPSVVELMAAGAEAARRPMA